MLFARACACMYACLSVHVIGEEAAGFLGVSKGAPRKHGWETMKN